MRWALLTGEYPPTPGGVGDHTRLLARGLAARGDPVHVLAPRAEGPDAGREAEEDREDGRRGVEVRRFPDRFGLASLVRLDAALRGLGRPRQLVVQYVPHAFGWRAMNVPLCAWLGARRAERPWIVFHEVAFPRGGPLRHEALAGTHRLMARLVLGAAGQVFVVTPAWERLLREVSPRLPPVTWLPVPSNVPVTAAPDAVAAARARATGGAADALVVGHFGTFGHGVADLLAAALPRILRADPARRALLVGRGGEAFAADLARADGDLTARVVATGGLAPDGVAAHLAACDLLVQPYADGATTRRGSLMAGLALGRAVVTTRGPDTEPVWETGAVLLAAPDPAVIAAAADAALRDPERRAALGRAAASLHAQRFAIGNAVRVLRGLAGAT